MARKLRLEAENAVYHVLNRGNYRTDIFVEDRTRVAFLRCLDEACRKTGWRVHAWCVMSTHFHVAITTPQPNLAAGMKWLLGTFAVRFNRLRGVQGHLFQGRYKSLIVDPEKGLGPVCHYIHLNPVRAHLCEVRDLAHYPWTSVAWLHRRRGAPAWYDPLPALQHAGDLPWTKPGAASYLKYLDWLAEDDPAQKEMKFASMTKGWFVGSPQFARALLEDHRVLDRRGMRQDAALGVAQEQIWQSLLSKALAQAQRSEAELRSAPKSAPWKLELGVQLRSSTTATNRWLGIHLHLGAPAEVSRNLGAWRSRNQMPATNHKD